MTARNDASRVDPVLAVDKEAQPPTSRSIPNAPAVVPLLPASLDGLREKATHASRGPWEVVDDARRVEVYRAHDALGFVASTAPAGTTADARADADYIAAASPDVILALLTAHTRLREERDEYARLAENAHQTANLLARACGVAEDVIEDGDEVEIVQAATAEVSRLTEALAGMRETVAEAERGADLEASALDDALTELADAQEALVRLANQLEAHGVPFVPEAEAATAKARSDAAQHRVLLARGMQAATEAYAAARRAPPQRGTE